MEFALLHNRHPSIQSAWMVGGRKNVLTCRCMATHILKNLPFTRHVDFYLFKALLDVWLRILSCRRIPSFSRHNQQWPNPLYTGHMKQNCFGSNNPFEEDFEIDFRIGDSATTRTRMYRWLQILWFSTHLIPGHYGGLRGHMDVLISSIGRNNKNDEYKH